MEVITNEEKKAEGKLTGVTEDRITIEYTEGKGKKAEIKTEEIYFNNIRQTRVQIKF